MTDPHAPAADADASGAVPALSNDDLDELDALLDDLRSRAEEIPQWEFCDGFLTALVCTRRAIAPAEYLPMLLDDGGPMDMGAEGGGAAAAAGLPGRCAAGPFRGAVDAPLGRGGAPARGHGGVAGG